MTDQQAATLRAGDKVAYFDEHEARVIETSDHAVTIKWADGEVSTFRFFEMDAFGSIKGGVYQMDAFTKEAK